MSHDNLSKSYVETDNLPEPQITNKIAEYLEPLITLFIVVN